MQTSGSTRRCSQCWSIPQESLHEERAAPMCSLSQQGPKGASGASQPGRVRRSACYRLRIAHESHRVQNSLLCCSGTASTTCCEAHSSTRHGHAHSAAYLSWKNFLIELASSQMLRLRARHKKQNCGMDGELWQASFPPAITKTPACCGEPGSVAKLEIPQMARRRLHSRHSIEQKLNSRCRRG